VLVAHVDLTANVVVGRHVAVMPQVVLTRDVQIEDWATVNTGAPVGSACLRKGIIIGERARVGDGIGGEPGRAERPVVVRGPGS
jgi:UDP-3-O-[3-hydroxymyristoyl] glucosamine N-acyltransferase